MKILSREWFNTSRSSTWTLYPLGDVHLGNEACHEKRFRQVVQEIAADDRALWVGLGDYCDFISRKDRRFDPLSLPKWLQSKADICGAQIKRFLDIVEPIAPKCLGLVEGNHERQMFRHYERDVYADIVTGVKDAGGFEPEHPLAFGISGWLVLKFYRDEKRRRQHTIRINVHHGFVGGRLAGAKSLNLQRWLWNHEADLVVFGHSHNSAVQVEAIERVRGSRVEYQNRIGCYAGTFMQGARYAEVKGYFPIPLTQTRVILRPGAKEQRERIKVVATA